MDVGARFNRLSRIHLYHMLCSTKRGSSWGMIITKNFVSCIGRENGSKHSQHSMLWNDNSGGKLLILLIIHTTSQATNHLWRPHLMSHDGHHWLAMMKEYSCTPIYKPFMKAAPNVPQWPPLTSNDERMFIWVINGIYNKAKAEDWCRTWYQIWHIHDEV